MTVAMSPSEAWLDLPHDQDTARTLLEFTVDCGFTEWDVRTGEDGYFVPTEVAELLYPAQPPQEATQ
jgi:hypothetical protein